MENKKKWEKIIQAMEILYLISKSKKENVKIHLQGDTGYGYIY